MRGLRRRPLLRPLAARGQDAGRQAGSAAGSAAGAAARRHTIARRLRPLCAVIVAIGIAGVGVGLGASLGAGLGAIALASAQQAMQPTYRTRSEGVRVDVLVTDGEKPVAGLTAKDFELLDGGVSQVVQASTLAETPVDVILVLDTSTSLGADGLGHLTRAADTLFARLKPSDRAALVTFSEDVMIRAALTPQHARVRAMLKGLETRGTTSVVDATYTGMLVQTDAVRPTLLLVFTDGLDTASWLAPDRVLETARRAALVPYAVVTGPAVQSYIERDIRPRGYAHSGQSIDESERFLWDFVRTGGGLFLNADSTRQLEERFAEALDSFRQRYVLTYVPQGVERQGWHALSIKVKGHRYRIRARPGYFVP